MVKFYCTTLLWFTSFVFCQQQATTVATDLDKQKTAKEASKDISHGKIQVKISGLNGKSHKIYKENAEAYLEVLTDNGKEISNPSYTRFLVESGVEQIKQSLQPFGFYRSEVTLDYQQKEGDWHASYQVELGDPIIVKAINLSLTGEAKQDDDYTVEIKNYPLKVGDVLLQEKYTEFKDKLISIAATNGYFDAKYTQSEIVLNEALNEAVINLSYDSGERYVFDDPRFTQDFLDDDIFERYKTFKKGDVYSAKEISNLQRNLYNSPYAKQVDIESKENIETKLVPVNFIITPKKNKKYRFALGFATDVGARVRFDFDWRWVNRRGHNFKSNLLLSQKLAEVGLEYRILGRRPATDYYRFFTKYKVDKTGDLDSAIFNIGGAYHDKVGHLDRELGLKWQQEDFEIGNDKANIGLLTPYLHLVYKKSDDPLNTTEGLLLDGYLTGASDSLLSDVSFLQAVAQAKYTKRFNHKHKATAKGAIGRTWVSDFHQLPPSYRFFTGGDRTIRGYAFNDIGDRDSSGDIIGGNKMYFMGLEYEYFFKENMAMATFVDVGDAFSSDSASLKMGAGLGFHYYSPIGPIKVDVAHGFNEPGDNVRLHLTIGPEF